MSSKDKVTAVILLVAIALVLSFVVIRYLGAQAEQEAKRQQIQQQQAAAAQTPPVAGASTVEPAEVVPVASVGTNRGGGSPFRKVLPEGNAGGGPSKIGGSASAGWANQGVNSGIQGDGFAPVQPEFMAGNRKVEGVMLGTKSAFVVISVNGKTEFLEAGEKFENFRLKEVKPWGALFTRDGESFRVEVGEDIPV